jgi:hypothetical protein
MLNVFLILIYLCYVFENKYLTPVYLLCSHCFAIILILCLTVAHSVSECPSMGQTQFSVASFCIFSSYFIASVEFLVCLNCTLIMYTFFIIISFCSYCNLEML